MIELPKLLPCPMCGSGAEKLRFAYIGRERNPPGAPDTHYTFSQHVDCTHCGMSSGRGPRVCAADQQRALNAAHYHARLAWNSRGQHDDDKSIMQFAHVLCEKGRGGWFDCDAQILADQFIGHMAKGNDGNFQDLAIFAMMLYTRGEDPKLLADAFNVAVEQKAHEIIMMEKCGESTQSSTA